LVTNSGFAIIISSPSGAGKTTITKRLLKKFKNSHLSVSCTTRKPRKGEVHGKDYFFISQKKFQNLKKQKKFLETAKVHDNHYGTLKTEVYKNLKKNKIVLLDIDWQGARSVKRIIKDNIFSFFLLPPSLKDLKNRLLKRHQDNKQIAIKRFSYAKKDIKHWIEYDYVSINDKIPICTKDIFLKIKLVINEKIKKEKITKLLKKFN